MPETDELAIDIKHIRWRQESIDASMDLLLKANKVSIMAEFEAFFQNSQRKVQVYLSIDGNRTVEEIAKALGMKQPNVSSYITQCAKEGLIEKVPGINGGYVWKKTRIDQVLRISDSLKKKFNL